MKELLTVLALMLVTSGCVVAPADHPGPGPFYSDYCDEYAQTAVEDYRKNQSWGCGFFGARWHDDYSIHYDWCRGTARSSAESERRARDDQLLSCGSSSGSGTSARCRDYARKAVEQYRKNRSSGCGFSGPRWHGDYDTHYDWCRSATNGQTRDEHRVRKDELRICRDSGERCQDYAREAVEQYRQNRRYRCGFSGPRWHGDYSDHHDWCRSVPAGQAGDERRGRDNDLSSCRAN